jgi:hypothetical protein
MVPHRHEDPLRNSAGRQIPARSYCRVRRLGGERRCEYPRQIATSRNEDSTESGASADVRHVNTFIEYVHRGQDREPNSLALLRSLWASRSAHPMLIIFEPGSAPEKAAPMKTLPPGNTKAGACWTKVSPSSGM